MQIPKIISCAKNYKLCKRRLGVVTVWFEKPGDR